VWAGFCIDDWLAVPDAGSPKFHNQLLRLPVPACDRSLNCTGELKQPASNVKFASGVGATITDLIIVFEHPVLVVTVSVYIESAVTRIDMRNVRDCRECDGLGGIITKVPHPGLQVTCCGGMTGW
jgi:hypothetical protein